MATARSDPLILCYDGSASARHAIERAAQLCAGGPALVLTVWQPTVELGSFSWAGATTGTASFAELDRGVAEDSGKIAAEGNRIARAAGLEAEPLAAKATGPVWKTIVETADRHHAAMIVIGSRGLTGLRSMLGSVSSAVVHHARQPTLVIHRPSNDAGDRSARDQRTETLSPV
jgi:nucleotide-binding universal stress UspA family protein